MTHFVTEGNAFAHLKPYIDVTKKDIYYNVLTTKNQQNNDGLETPFLLKKTVLYSSSKEKYDDILETAPEIAVLRKQILDLIGDNTENSNDKKVKKSLTSLLESLQKECGGSQKGNE
eukprot:12793950-Ditylum_brightwellii.AAC.1